MLHIARKRFLWDDRLFEQVRMVNYSRDAVIIPLTFEFDADFQRFITEGAWGSIWSRPHLTKRERSIVTLALLAALGHDEEVAMHTRATVNTGATPEDVREALLHVAVYAGVPAANQAFKIVKKTYAEMAGETKK